ncbi:MAG: transposase [Myxococcales bacterium]|nr:transposase [Myxococcales bacterium]
MDGLEALRKENAELRAQVAQLLTELARLNDRVSELLAVAQRKQRKAPAPGAAAPAAAPPVVEGEAQRAFEERPKAPDKPAAEPPPKKKARPTGRKPIPSHLEAEEHELRPDACGECGGAALDVVDELVEEKLHVVKEHQRRRVVRRYTCRCRECGERTTLRSLPAPYERSKVTCEWLAWLVYQKFWLLTPLDRIRRDLAERGVPIAMSTLVTFIERAADLLSGIDGLHWKQLLAGSWMATDGTGLKVIIKKLPAAHNGYVGLYRNHDVAVFQYEPDKSGEVVAAKLRPFRGTLTADAEHRFNDVFASGRVLEAGCNAHGRRKFRDAEDTQPVLALEGGAFLGAIYGEEGEAQKLGLVGEALREHRQRCIRPIVQDFERWRDAVEPTLLPSSRWRRRFGTTRTIGTRSSVSSTTRWSPSTTLPPSASFRTSPSCASTCSSPAARKAPTVLACSSASSPPVGLRCPCAGLSHLGLRAPRDPPRCLRAAARGPDPRRVQEDPRLSPTHDSTRRASRRR